MKKAKQQPEQPPERKRTGRSPKPDDERVYRRIGAGISRKDWPQVQATVDRTGQTISTRIRWAFGLPPAKP